MDVTRVSRDAYADAFRQVTGRSLVALPQLAGASDSEILFESLALNDAQLPSDDGAGVDLLAAYTAALTSAFAERRDLLVSRGKVLPGAREAVAAAARLPGVIQSVLTGSIQTNATEKLRAFGLLRYLDTEIGGFGSDAYPKGTLLLRSRGLAQDKYQVQPDDLATVYIADSVRDVAAALTGGASCLGVATGRPTAAELHAAGAAMVIDALTDTRAVVAAIDQRTSKGS